MIFFFSFFRRIVFIFIFTKNYLECRVALEQRLLLSKYTDVNFVLEVLNISFYGSPALIKIL